MEEEETRFFRYKNILIEAVCCCPTTATTTTTTLQCRFGIRFILYICIIYTCVSDIACIHTYGTHCASTHTNTRINLKLRAAATTTTTTSFLPLRGKTLRERELQLRDTRREQTKESVKATAVAAADVFIYKIRPPAPTSIPRRIQSTCINIRPGIARIYAHVFVYQTTMESIEEYKSFYGCTRRKRASQREGRNIRGAFAVLHGRRKEMSRSRSERRQKNANMYRIIFQRFSRATAVAVGTTVAFFNFGAAKGAKKKEAKDSARCELSRCIVYYIPLCAHIKPTISDCEGLLEQGSERGELSKGFKVKNLQKNIREICKCCAVCVKNKTRGQNKYGLMAHLGPAKAPLEIVSIDMIGGFGGSRSTKRYLHLLVDHFTRYAWITTSKTQNSKDFIKLLQVDLKPTIAVTAAQAAKLPEKRKGEDIEANKDLKKAKLETKALKAKRPGFTDERYNETSYYIENGLRKVYPYYFTFTTFTKGRWVGEKILEVFAREFRAHPAEEYERCIRAGTLTVNYQKVDVDYRLRHNDLLANVVHRHEVPVTSEPITVIHMDEDVVVVNKPASIPVHPCGRYRHNTVVFILAKEYGLKNLRTIHRLDRLTSGILLFGRTPKKARQMEHQIRNRQVKKQYVCRVEGEFPEEEIVCSEPIEVVSYKIGVCKVSEKGKDCLTKFKRLSYNGQTSVVLCKPQTGRMHQIRVHLQYLGYPVCNDPLYNHTVFGPVKGKGGMIGKSDEELVKDLIGIHNAENWLGMDGDSEMSLFKTTKLELDDRLPSSDKEGSPSSTPSLNDEEQQQQQVQSTSSPSSQDQSATSTTSTSTSTSTVQQQQQTPQPSLKVTVGTQTGSEPPDSIFSNDKVTVDQHCYECKVKYRDPKPSDLVMYLHAWRYCGPGWEYETPLPAWAASDWAPAASGDEQQR
ncbi:unnamed protein product [Trichogramma brassicae]|uniref:Pseudouridylate synthase RPUSD2 n=1 Tax=Trichogramma brassicae TaxID=86971 RepID=A0A6H5IZ50_9HYME|nr:unnamed protein product [Trichogramma brassicae]